MDFAFLQERLVALMRERVRSGEVTERGLAMLAGVSQPHVHHVLKGARRLSTDMADHLLRRLHIDLFELMEEPWPRNYRAVPCLRAPLGPGKRFPAEGGGFYPFRREDIEKLEDPVVAQAGEDKDLPLPLQENDWVLLDRGRRACLGAGPGLYVVESREGAVIRSIPAPRFSLQDRAMLEVMKAKVVWFGRRLESSPIG